MHVTGAKRQARENACERGTIRFNFASHQLKKWREFCQPITERSKAKLKQTRNNFRPGAIIRDGDRNEMPF